MMFAARCQCALMMSNTRRRISRCLLLLAAFGAVSGGGAAGAQVTLYVDDDALPGGNGLSWATAFQHPQQALDVASSAPGPSYVVKIGQGRYVPTKRTDPDDPRSATFQLINNVALEGGYAGIANGDPDRNDRVAFETILSGLLDNNERLYHVTKGSGASLTAVLDGFTVRDSYANMPSKPPVYSERGGGMLNVHGSPTISRCVFVANIAKSGGAMFNVDSSHPAIIECEFRDNSAFGSQGIGLATGYGGGIYNLNESNPTISECTFISNVAQNGGAMYCRSRSNPIVTQCVFVRNSASVHGGALGYWDADPYVLLCLFDSNKGLNTGAIHMHYQADVPAPKQALIQHCQFLNNQSESAGGAISVAVLDHAFVADCAFIANHAAYLGGGASIGGRTTLQDCTFSRNTSGWLGGGASIWGDGDLVNCSFSRNSAATGGGGISIIHAANITNCSIAGNVGGGILAATSTANIQIVNSIIYTNSPFQISVDDIGPPEPLVFVEGVVVRHSNIQGGWSGAGSNNIDANPMFIQPGCDDLRLGHNSPCIDAGDNGAVPPGTDTDLDGQPRIQNGIVDMGAYEGGHDPLPPTACEDDLDLGELVNLIPGQGTPSPAGHPLLSITNVNGPDNAIVTAVELIDDPHPGALGFANLARTLHVETTLLNGQMFSFIRVPFDEASLNGADPMDVELVYFEPALNRWIRAAEANTQNSPDHAGPLGDRFAQSGPTNPLLSTDLGDYGVFWNTTTHRGYAWANVDHATDFAVGLPLALCPADCDSPPDGQVNLHDLVSVLKAWGQTGPAAGAQDVDRSGVVDMDDLVMVISAWGACP